jgi:hypothetical protein
MGTEFSSLSKNPLSWALSTNSSGSNIQFIPIRLKRPLVDFIFEPMGNTHPRQRCPSDKIYKFPNKGKEKEELLLGEPKKLSFPYKKLSSIFFINMQAPDLKTLRVDFLYYSDSQTFVIEPILNDIPVHAEHVCITVAELKDMKAKYLEVDIEYFSLPYMTFDLPKLFMLLQTNFKFQ